MGELIYQTMYVDPEHQPQVFDYIHTIETDGTERKFDFAKVIPEPAEFPIPPSTSIWAPPTCVNGGQTHWRYHNWGCCMNAWDAKYKTCVGPISPHYGQIGLQFVTKNGIPWQVFRKLSAVFPDATITVFYDFEAGYELDWAKEVVKGGYMVENIVKCGQPLDREELDRFPEDTVEELSMGDD